MADVLNSNEFYYEEDDRFDNDKEFSSRGDGNLSTHSPK